MLELQLQYKGEYERMLEKASITDRRIEYGVRCISLPLGYYCPSLVFDIIIGGISRGRIVKDKKGCSKYDYVYFKDSTDRVIAADCYYPLGDSIRLLEKAFCIKDDSQLIVPFYDISGEEPQVLRMIKCEYMNDGKLRNYRTISSTPNNSLDIKQRYDHAKSYEEYYTYNDTGLLDRVVMINRVMDIVEKHHYAFTHNDDGLLISYENTETGKEYSIPKSKQRKV